MTLPDPLVGADGRRVETPEQWWQVRRPELAELFQREMYGTWPGEDAGAAVVVTAREDRGDRSFTLREFTVTLPGRPPLPILVTVPNGGIGPVPVVVSLNFTGNDTVSGHPRWPLELIARRGHAVVTADYRDVRPDAPQVEGGMAPPATPAVAAWAWGLSLLVDLLIDRPEIHNGRIDTGRIAAGGHSRLGKAALLATAFDDRIGLALVNQAGCGGSAPSRTVNPAAETVERVTTAFPHWFAERFATYGRRVDELPFDQHCLVAMCAPRPVLFTAADGDQWADPPGQVEVLRAAVPAYRLLGIDEPFDVADRDGGRLLDGRLGYRLRPGRHDMTAEDWRTWLDFADLWLGR